MTTTLCPLTNISPFPHLLMHGNHHSTLCFCKFIFFSIYKWDHVAFFCFWFILFSPMSCRFIHVLTKAYKAICVYVYRLPWWLVGEELACQCRKRKFNPWVRKFPCRRKWQPTPASLPGKSYGQRNLSGYSPCGGTEADTTTQWLNKSNKIHMQLIARQKIKDNYKTDKHLLLVWLCNCYSLNTIISWLVNKYHPNYH